MKRKRGGFRRTSKSGFAPSARPPPGLFRDQPSEPEFEEEEEEAKHRRPSADQNQNQNQDQDLVRLVEASAPVRICAEGEPLKSALDNLGLSAEQRRVFDLALRGESFFFTGSAGTGKTHTLKAIIRELEEQCPGDMVYVTASTGVAACNIGGCTLHSFAGIGLGEGTVDELHTRVRKYKQAMLRWTSACVLIIDEISMVDAALFDKIETLARRVRASAQPFGGIQVILCGDFFQLPPVHGSPVFTAACWPRVVKHCIELRSNFRQRTDFELAEVLHQIRFGIVTPRAKEILNRCATPYAARDADSSSATRATLLYPHRVDVNHVNTLELAKLKTRAHVYEARDKGSNRGLRRLLKHCQAPQEVQLKKGALVVLTKNIDADRGLVNGAQGVVAGFNKLCSSSEYAVPIVRFNNGTVASIREAMFEVKIGRDCATRYQIPLVLGYAISIHRSQGMTLDRVQMKLANVWECGQAYVALSRASTAAGLYLVNYDPRKIRADPAVVAFHRAMYADLLR